MVDSPKESAPEAKGTGSTLVSARVWDVLSPPPVNSVKGALIPRALTRKRHRKISVEVHRLRQNNINNNKGNDGKDSTNQNSYEECIVRFLEPATKAEKLAARKRVKDGKPPPRTLGAASVQDTTLGGLDDDASTAAGVPAEFLDAKNTDFFAKPNFDKGWEAKYRFPLKNMSIKGTSKTGVFVHVQLGHVHQTRQLIFDSVEEATDFVSVVEQEFKLEADRGATKLRLAFAGKEPPKAEMTFLVELVSAWNLPAGDLYWSDPYVIVTLGGTQVHRTKHISKTLDPIWTLKTDSLFLFTVATKDLFLSDGLRFTIKDYDQVGNDEVLGIFYADPQTIFDANGERLTYKLEPPPGATKEVPGHAAIRCRRASEADIAFLEDYKQSKKRNVMGVLKERGRAKEEVKGGASNLASYFRRQARTIKVGNEEIKQYKIRPDPDPKRVEETTWMTEKDIKTESMKESHQWVDTGNGHLGRLFVEILSCEDLPNLDTGGRNKTDAFISVVFEDSVGQTDIIDDCLNPVWLPWTRRAFIFHMLHSSSQLFLGVFDFDEGVNPTDDHDLIGRVSIDLSNLRPDTIYNLRYNIYTTARMSERKCKGTITVRLRLDIPDERKLLLSNLEPPPEMYVNVKKRKDYRVVHYTCTGKYDMSRYDMKYINAYIEEILALQNVVYYLQDAVMALILWRGTLPIKVLGKEIYLPVHSLSAFLALTMLVEHPQLFPALLFGSIGWFMVAVMDYRRGLPDPWSRCKIYSEFFWTLISGSSYLPAHSIAAFENQEESAAYMKEWQTRIQDAEKQAAKAYEENLKAQEEYEKEMDEVGDATTDISTKRKGISIDPFKPILFPVQQNLAMVCRYVRHVKHIISWEECYISFWITVGCFLISFICLFVPWFFIMTWTARLLVWVGFGPWMKLVDVFYVQKLKPLSEEELETKKEADRQKRKEATSVLRSEARIKRENASKLKAMKKYMFGKFITRVPVLKEDRYRDVPLPDSTAVPYRPELLPLSEVAMQEAGYNRKRVPGQHLVGDMIPKAESVGFTEAPVGQATAHPRLVDKSGPGGAVGGGPESNIQAYTKIGSVVVAAAVVSWCIVPVFSSLTEQVLNWL